MAEKASPTRAKEIETLFDALCVQPPTVHLCKNCGLEMINIDVLFFLANNERSWNIPLAVCTKCNREEYLKFISRQAA